MAAAFNPSYCHTCSLLPSSVPDLPADAPVGRFGLLLDVAGTLLSSVEAAAHFLEQRQSLPL